MKKIFVTIWNKIKNFDEFMTEYYIYNMVGIGMPAIVLPMINIGRKIESSFLLTLALVLVVIQSICVLLLLRNLVVLIRNR